MTSTAHKTCEKIIPVSAALQGRWRALRDALDAAAKPHTGKETFTISPFYARDLPGAEAELDRALKSISAEEVHGEFNQGPLQDARELRMRLWWREER
jgi:hypothetical protein